jgi:hypothetical protein
MKAKLSLLLATFLLASLSATFAKPPEPELEEDVFIGLWEGVWDTTSGFGAIRSITVNDDDTYTILGDWSDHTDCILRGTGTIEEDVLVVDDMTKYCTYGTYSTPTTYTFDERNGVLREEYHYLGDILHTILHKTSR